MFFCRLLVFSALARSIQSSPPSCFLEFNEYSSEDPDVVARTKQYSVDSDCAAYFTTQKETHHIRQLPVFGTDELPISTDDFEDKLAPGTLVEVIFNLYHYAMGPAGTPTSDTFSAHLVNVSILQEAPKRNIQRKIPARRPNHIPQSPTKRLRSDQAHAAAAFIPATIPQATVLAEPDNAIAGPSTVEDGSSGPAHEKRPLISESESMSIVYIYTHIW